MRNTDDRNERREVTAEGLITPDNSPGRIRYLGPSLGTILAGVRVPPPEIPVANWQVGLQWAERGLSSEAELKALLFDIGIEPDAFLTGVRTVAYRAQTRGTGTHRMQMVTDAFRAILVLSVRVSTRGTSITRSLPDDITPERYSAWRRRMTTVFPEFGTSIAASLADRCVVLGQFRCDVVGAENWLVLARIADLIGGHPGT